jgi:serine phosphatase RsbU (regulator of sigma subunit)
VSEVLAGRRTATVRLPGGNALVTPLLARRHVLGTLTVGVSDGAGGPDGVGGRPLTGEVSDIVEDLARRAALAMDNARLFVQQVAVANALQARLLPPDLPSGGILDFGAAYRAAGPELQVGGDFYDVCAVGPDAWAMSIGDVCGKGAEAAAVTGVTRDVLRLLGRQGVALPEALRQLNRTLCDQGEAARSCTVAAARLTTERAVARVSLCLAGHPQPVLVRHGRHGRLVGVPGTLLGALPTEDLSLSEVTLRLEPGDALVLYTDGVTETRAGDRLFGEGQVLRTVTEAAGRPAQAIADALLQASSRFADHPRRDDLAVLVVKVRPAGP